MESIFENMYEQMSKTSILFRITMHSVNDDNTTEKHLSQK